MGPESVLLVWIPVAFPFPLRKSQEILWIPCSPLKYKPKQHAQHMHMLGTCYEHMLWSPLNSSVRYILPLFPLADEKSN